MRTHQKTDQELCGKPIELKQGYSRVELLTTMKMAVDDAGLVHGGFVFGLADFAAMVAVNHPNVVLGSSQVKFLKPVRVGETVIAEAMVSEVSGKKHKVDVTVQRGGETVFQGEFICFILEKHVLSS